MALGYSRGGWRRPAGKHAPPPSVCTHPTQDAGALKQAHHHLDQNEYDDDPLKPGGVSVVAVVAQPAGEGEPRGAGGDEQVLAIVGTPALNAAALPRLLPAAAAAATAATTAAATAAAATCAWVQRRLAGTSPSTSAGACWCAVSSALTCRAFLAALESGC